MDTHQETASHDRLYRRSRLLDVLEQAVRGPSAIIWISAQAGSGKTTLLGQFAARSAQPCIWYQVDETDQDLSSFFHRLAQTTKRTLPSTQARPSWQPGPGVSAMAFMRQYVRALQPSGHKPGPVLLLDDAQALEEQHELFEVLGAAAEEWPHDGALLIASRRDPPPALRRLQAYGSLQQLQQSDLNLTAQEIGPFCAKVLDQQPDSKALNALYRRTRGWLIGLVLTAHSSGQNRPCDDPLRGPTPLLLDYLQHEVFRPLPEAVQAASLRLSLTPRFAMDLISELADDSGMTLARLMANNPFLQQSPDRPGCCQFHPLYRECLLTLGKQYWTSEERQRHLLHAATLHAEHGFPDEAAEAFMEADAAPELSRLIEQQAGSLLASGRFQTLQRWLDAVEDSARQQSPWLCYWQGMVRQSCDLADSRRWLSRAWTLFQAQDDLQGSLLAWSGVTQTYHYQWSDFRELDPWLDTGLPLIEAHYTTLTNPTRTLVTLSLFRSLLYRRPEPPLLSRWLLRTQSLLDEPLPSDLQFDIAQALLMHHLWFGEMRAAERLISRMAGLAAPTAPLTALYWRAMVANHYWLAADAKRCAEAADQGHSLIKTYDLTGHDFFLLAPIVHGYLVTGELDRATRCLRDLEHLILPDSHLHRSHYEFLLAMQALLAGDLHRALHFALSAHHSGEICGALMPAAQAVILLGRVQTELGQLEAAQATLQRAGNTAAATGSYFLLFSHGLALALLAEQSGQRHSALAALRPALQAGAAGAVVTTDWWDAQALGPLFALALQENIEQPYVRRLIQQRQLPAPSHRPGTDCWPWPVRLLTLGTFEIWLDDQPLDVNLRTQRKPLTLLQALIALGGQQVPENQLEDLLWPDAEGHQARQNLKTTVHRARRLVGQETIQWQGGALSLNAGLCQVDIEVLEQHLRTLTTTPDAEAELLLHQALTVLDQYTGPFLPEVEAPWCLERRERLRSLLSRSLEALAVALVKQHKVDAAIEVYRRLLEIDSLAEPAYQGLIRLYLAEGRTAQAVATFRRCRQHLQAQLKIEPSAQTLSLVRPWL